MLGQFSLSFGGKLPLEADKNESGTSQNPKPASQKNPRRNQKGFRKEQAARLPVGSP
jgi:hypothetical protein